MRHSGKLGLVVVAALAAVSCASQPSQERVPVGVVANFDNATRTISVQPDGATTAFSASQQPPRSDSAHTSQDTHVDIRSRRCTSLHVRSTVGAFIRAFNAGDQETLDRVFADSATFRWYSTNGPGARLRARARDRESLSRYFAKRHARSEQLRVRRLRFRGNSEGHGHFVFAVTRRADDMRPRVFRGKGAMECEGASRGRIIVWSMARASRSR